MFSDIFDFLDKNKVSYVSLSKKDSFKVQKKWLDVFAQNVFNSCAHWVYDGYKWHGFLNGWELSVEKEKAILEIESATIEPFYLFNENGRLCLMCNAGSYPKFDWYNDDIYILNESLLWTMVYTHELGYGPYFAHSNNLHE